MITKQFLDVIRADINAALAEVGKKHGMDIKMGNIKYMDTSFTASLSAAEQVEDPWLVGVDPAYIHAAKRNYTLAGMLGKKYKVGPSTVVVVGLKGRSKVVIRHAPGGPLYLMDYHDAIMGTEIKD